MVNLTRACFWKSGSVPVLPIHTVRKLRCAPESSPLLSIMIWGCALVSCLILASNDNENMMPLSVPFLWSGALSPVRDIKSVESCNVTCKSVQQTAFCLCDPRWRETRTSTDYFGFQVWRLNGQIHAQICKNVRLADFLT